MVAGKPSTKSIMKDIHSHDQQISEMLRGDKGTWKQIEADQLGKVKEGEVIRVLYLGKHPMPPGYYFVEVVKRHVRKGVGVGYTIKYIKGSAVEAARLKDKQQYLSVYTIKADYQWERVDKGDAPIDVNQAKKRRRPFVEGMTGTVQEVVDTRVMEGSRRQ